MLSERKAMFWRGMMIISATLLMNCTAAALEKEAIKVASPQAAVGCDSDSETFAEFMKPGWNLLPFYPNNTQLMIIGSDPQAYRYMSSRSPYNENIDDRWPNAVVPVFQAIAAERSAVNYYVPFIINGDLTEFGHGGERRTTRFYLKNYLPGGVGGPLFLPGLGNHDYDNNVNDCENNGCARDSVCDLITWVQAINPKDAFDYQYVSGNRHIGSLAYSVTVGRVHIIQLNQEPFYTRSFSTGGNSTGKPRRYFDITSSMQWLQDDLRIASERGEAIIINMHKPTGWVTDDLNAAWFAELVSHYNVTAIFAGHFHNSIGRYSSRGDVPVFLSGGLLAKSYLRLKFNWTSMQLSVEPVLLDQGPRAPSVVDIRRQERKEYVVITLYEHENRQGASCKFILSDRETKAGQAFPCLFNFGYSNSSARVDGFAAGSELCFMGRMGETRCIRGNYSGSFNLDTFNGTPSLPNGLVMSSSGGSMNDNLKAAAYNVEWNTIELYEHENFGGQKCSIRVRQYEAVDVEKDCGAGWKYKTSSAKILGFKPGSIFRFETENRISFFWDYRSTNFQGDLDIPSFITPGPLPSGVEFYQSGQVNDRIEMVWRPL
ncbi:metallophosphoesterase [Pseudomonas sp. EMN2]|uniref:metallophosphoesterase family protein n=1 Tax=Pseudomonas sp. EMN2 TaxID=2615212 RepID=UPI00129A7486|nr:metallophosphoesterase [Pseudomonas sp. EMN2]